MGNTNNPLSDVAKILESEPVKNAISPLTKELGGMLGTLANVARFYMTDNLERIFVRWAANRNGREPDAEEVKKVLPLLPLASMVSDRELQEKWATLLESTVKQDSCLPSFGQTLAQLSTEEVRYLDRLWKLASQPTFRSVRRTVTSPLPFVNMVKIFDPNIDTGVNAEELRVFEQWVTAAQWANFTWLGRAQLVIDDLIRLGIISEDQVIEVKRDKPVLNSEYSFSQYGVSFMGAVTAKSENQTLGQPRAMA